MRIRKIDYPLNTRREEIIMKGFCTPKEIMDFIPCGRKCADEIYAAINEEIKSKGKNPLLFGVPVKKVLDYLGMTESQISKYAAKEKVST